MPIEVKSGKDFRQHRALDKFVENEDYHIKKAILYSNDSKEDRSEKEVYLPISYAKYLTPSTPDSFIIP